MSTTAPVDINIIIRPFYERRSPAGKSLMCATDYGIRIWISVILMSKKLSMLLSRMIQCVTPSIRNTPSEHKAIGLVLYMPPISSPCRRRRRYNSALYAIPARCAFTSMRWPHIIFPPFPQITQFSNRKSPTRSNSHFIFSSNQDVYVWAENT